MDTHITKSVLILDFCQSRDICGHRQEITKIRKSSRFVCLNPFGSLERMSHSVTVSHEIKNTQWLTYQRQKRLQYKVRWGEGQWPVSVECSIPQIFWQKISTKNAQFSRYPKCRQNTESAIGMLWYSVNTAFRIIWCLCFLARFYVYWLEKISNNILAPLAHVYLNAIWLLFLF